MGTRATSHPLTGTEHSFDNLHKLCHQDVGSGSGSHQRKYRHHDSKDLDSVCGFHDRPARRLVGDLGGCSADLL